MKYVRLLVGVAALAVALGPRDGESCGPITSFLLFSTARYALPADLSSGHLGVLRPQYQRADLLLAYRILAGVPLSGNPAPPPDWTGPGWERAKPWLEARRLVPGLPAKATLDADKKVPGEDYQFYANCLDNAFQNAAATLQKRIAQWGAGSPQVADWVRGQDQVFANCSAGPEIPNQLDSGDPLLIADRHYQIAAARFYAEQYEDSVADFDKIAADPASPWHEIAPYLAARACIRMATIAAKEKLPDAAERLRAILADPARRQLHKPAQALLDFVRARTEPQQRLIELGNQLVEPGSEPQLGRVVADYTKIWRQLERDQKDLPVNASEVADWVTTLRSGQNAIEKWRSKPTLLWLVAALARSGKPRPPPPDLIAAAQAVPPDSPAYASATYYGILAQIREAKLDDARRWADQALGAKQPDSVTNLLRAERLKLARDWTEFLRFAPRKPVATGTDLDDSEEPLDQPDPKRPTALDVDSTQPLNHLVPLKLWIDASRNPLMPRALETDLAQAGWVRAIILGDEPAARNLAQRVAQLKPELATEMRAYAAERDPAAARFSAVFLMLRAPGLEPEVRPGFQRQTPVLERDILRDNWWTLASGRLGTTPAAYEALTDLYPDLTVGPADFLPKDQRAAGEAEWKRLVETAGNSVNYLCSETIAWARTHPQDPRVPQALHLSVQATHYGPTDKSSTQYSKQAFDLLHRRYPDSEWTTKTKYWY